MSRRRPSTTPERSGSTAKHQFFHQFKRETAVEFGEARGKFQFPFIHDAEVDRKHIGHDKFGKARRIGQDLRHSEPIGHCRKRGMHGSHRAFLQFTMDRRISVILLIVSVASS